MEVADVWLVRKTLSKDVLFFMAIWHFLIVIGMFFFRKKVEEQEAEIESLKNTLKEREAHVKKIEGKIN